MINRYVLIVVAAVWAFTTIVSFSYGVRWEKGREAIIVADLKERSLAAERAQGQQSLEHAAVVRSLNTKLGDARAQIAAAASGRDCLGPDLVGVLNGLGSPVPAAASGPAPAASAAATDRDVGDALAVCRGEYARVADQLNKILDIEDKRAGALPAAN